MKSFHKMTWCKTKVFYVCKVEKVGNFLHVHSCQVLLQETKVERLKIH
jgi:hypothetical protein